MNFTNRHNLKLDPALDGTGGGAASGNAPEATAGAAPAEAPQFDPNSFKTEILGSLRSELGRVSQEFNGRFQELGSRMPRQEVKEDSRPSLEKYLVNGELPPGAFEKYQDDLLSHRLKAERAEWQKEIQTNQSKQEQASTFRKVQQEHLTRETEYEKANPTYRQDIMSAGDMEVSPTVGQRILRSKYSANIIHHFAKNRGDFSRFQALSYDDPEGALEELGELSASFKSRESDSTRQAIPARPTRGAFGGGGAKPTSRGVKEILAEWRN